MKIDNIICNCTKCGNELDWVREHQIFDDCDCNVNANDLERDSMLEYPDILWSEIED